VIARTTIALHVAESPPPAQDLAAKKSGLGETSRAGFFGGRMPLAGAATTVAPKTGAAKTAVTVTTAAAAVAMMVAMARRRAPGRDAGMGFLLSAAETYPETGSSGRRQR